MRKLAGAVLLVACGSADAPEPEACDTAPVLAWANFGEGFFLDYCQGCHASTAPDRFGAPASVSFDTEGDVLTRVADVLSVTQGEAARMPPGGGVPEEDLRLLATWLQCAGGR